MRLHLAITIASTPISRRDRGMLEIVLRRATRRSSTPSTFSTAELVAAAAKSMARWAKAGFTTVDDAQYHRRLAACAGCEHLRAVPRDKATLYRIAGLEIDRDAICGLCGCGVRLKARRTTESCPADAGDGLTRWGEPRAGAER